MSNPTWNKTFCSVSGLILNNRLLTILSHFSQFRALWWVSALILNNLLFVVLPAFSDLIFNNWLLSVLRHFSLLVSEVSVPRRLSVCGLAMLSFCLSELFKTSFGFCPLFWLLAICWLFIIVLVPEIFFPFITASRTSLPRAPPLSPPTHLLVLVTSGWSMFLLKKDQLAMVKINTKAEEKTGKKKGEQALVTALPIKRTATG